MRDARAAVADQRNALERLVQRIPGFRSYYDRENRRQADALLREWGVARLERVIAGLQGQKCQAELADIGAWQRTLKQVEILRNELRHADQGYSGFFDELKLDAEEALDALYAFDEEIVERAAGLVDAVERDEASGDDLLEEVGALRRAFHDRKASILKLAEE